MSCDASCELDSSIVLENVSAAVTGTDADVDPLATLVQTVTGVGASRGLACDPIFFGEDDLHLDVSTPGNLAANRACVVDRSGAGEAVTALDVDGGAIEGASFDIGADEAA